MTKREKLLAMTEGRNKKKIPCNDRGKGGS
jgi:hypothetical protein